MPGTLEVVPWPVSRARLAALSSLSATRPAVAAVTAIAILAGACTDPMGENRAKSRPWLDERPRTLALTLDEDPPAPRLIDRNSRVVAGIKGFTVGALAGAAAPWISGSPPTEPQLAGAVTAVFALIGAVAVAVMFASDPEESTRPLAEEPGLSALLGAALAQRRFERALQSAVVAAVGAGTRHRLSAVDPSEPAGWTALPDGTDGLVTLEVGAIGFHEQGGDPPRFAFLVRGKTYLARDWRPPGAESWPRGFAVARWQSEGRAHTAAALAAAGGALFEAEKRATIDSLAAQIVEAVGRGPRETATPEGGAESLAHEAR